MLQHFRVLRYDHPGHGLTPAAPGPYRLDDFGGAESPGVGEDQRSTATQPQLAARQVQPQAAQAAVEPDLVARRRPRPAAMAATAFA